MGNRYRIIKDDLENTEVHIPTKGYRSADRFRTPSPWASRLRQLRDDLRTVGAIVSNIPIDEGMRSIVLDSLLSHGAEVLSALGREVADRPGFKTSGFPDLIGSLKGIDPFGNRTHSNPAGYFGNQGVVVGGRQTAADGPTTQTPAGEWIKDFFMEPPKWHPVRRTDDAFDPIRDTRDPQGAGNAALDPLDPILQAASGLANKYLPSNEVEVGPQPPPAKEPDPPRGATMESELKMMRDYLDKHTQDLDWGDFPTPPPGVADGGDDFEPQGIRIPRSAVKTPVGTGSPEPDLEGRVRGQGPPLNWKVGKGPSDPEFDPSKGPLTGRARATQTKGQRDPEDSLNPRAMSAHAMSADQQNGAGASSKRFHALNGLASVLDHLLSGA
jgi:hypothetical protein